MYPAYVALKPPKPITLEKGRGNESADGGAGAAEPPASGSNDTLEPKVLVLSLVLANFVPPPRGGVSWRLAGNEGARRFLPDPSTGPGNPGRAATGPGRNSIVVTLNHPAAAAVIPGNAPPPGFGAPGPTPARRQQSTPRGRRGGQPTAHLPSAGPTPAAGDPPKPGPGRAWVCASRGSTYFVTGALGFVVAAGRHSLGGWRRHCSPGAGAHSPVPQLQHLPLSRSAAAASCAPKPELRAGSRWRASLRPTAPHSTSPAEPRSRTRAHRGGAATAPGHPQNGINERALEAACSERGAGDWLGACGAGSGRPARAEEAETRRGRGLPGARLHAEAQVGRAEGAGRGKGA